MSDDSDPVWYWGEAHEELVTREMMNADDGSFVVFHGGDLEYHTLVYKVNGTLRFVPIYYRDQLFGFTEPLGFESLTDVIEAHNDSPTETEDTLTMPLPKPVLSKPTEDSADLLKKLRHLSKLVRSREEELEQIVRCTEKLERTIDEQSRSIEAFEALAKILEAQREKSTRLSAGSRECIEAFKHNQKMLEAKLESLIKEKEELLDDRRRIEQERNDQAKEHSKCFASLQGIEEEIGQLKEGLIQIALYENSVDIFKLFMERLLLEDSREHPATIPQRMKGKVAESFLKSREEGTYIVRQKDKIQSPYVISLCYFNGLETRVHHFPVLHIAGSYGFDKSTCIFENIHDLVVCYSRMPFCVHGMEFGDVTLTEQLIVQDNTATQRTARWNFFS